VEGNAFHLMVFLTYHQYISKNKNQNQQLRQEPVSKYEMIRMFKIWHKWAAKKKGRLSPPLTLSTKPYLAGVAGAQPAAEFVVPPVLAASSVNDIETATSFVEISFEQ